MATITNVNINVQAGSTYTIKVPTTLANHGGFFPRTGKVSIIDSSNTSVTRTLQNGFCLEDETVGEITKAYSSQVAIDYKHNLTSENTIWFYALTGERARITTSAIVVHDHSSIATGGPAYATYFSYVDDSTTED